MIVIISIIIALVAAFYASLLPEIPMFSRASSSKAVPAAISSLTAKLQDSTSNNITTVSGRAPVYFLSHGGVRSYILPEPRNPDRSGSSILS